MVSKKKARGKARKAAAKAKKEEENDNDDSSTAAAQRQQREQEGALEAQLQIQMQRLLIESLPPPCQHGFVTFPAGHICDRFLTLYTSALNSSSGSEDNFFERILKAMEAVEEKYPEVLHDSSKMKQILSYHISRGTQRILNGDDDDDARGISAMIVMWEEFIALRVNETQADMHTQKMLEMVTSDDHTLVSFYRKRISCTCLDKKHKEVKSIKKMGFCNNSQCPHPGRKVERSKMLYCTRCSVAYYCSRDCQKAAWSDHREVCNDRAEKNAKFEQEMRIRDQNSM